MVGLHDDAVHDFEAFDYGWFDFFEEGLVLLHVVLDYFLLKFHLVDVMLLNKSLHYIFLPNKVISLAPIFCLSASSLNINCRVSVFRS